jgi:pimeloyl-ACP methyl ester carboxylesterase
MGLKAFAIVLMIFTCSAFCQTIPTDHVPHLPIPSGTFGIGRTAFDWVDTSRPADIASPDGRHSEIMVFVWYPTERPTIGARGELFPGSKEIDANPAVPKGLKAQILGGNWALAVSGTLTSHAIDDAKPATNPKRFPVVLYSPGAFMSAFQSTSFIEDLVSHGYVVASIEHAYETFATKFPDGRVIPYSAREIQPQFLPSANASKSEFNEKLQDWSRHRTDVRAADLSFTLNRLTELNKGAGSSRLKRRLDLSRVAAVGHSRGGWAAIVACRRDQRFAACVNLDGNAAGEGLSFPGTSIPTQPILFIEVPPRLPADWIVLTEQKITPGEWLQRWHERANRELESSPAGGDFVELTVGGLEHNSFSDEVLLRAAKAEHWGEYDDAVAALQLIEETTRTFLSRTVNRDGRAELGNTSKIKVRHFSARAVRSDGER